MFIIKLNMMLVFLGLFIMYIAFPQVKIGTAYLYERLQVLERLNKIKNYGKIDIKKLNKGMQPLKPLRMILGSRIDVRYSFEEKKRNIENLELKIEIMDLLIIKGLISIASFLMLVSYILINSKRYGSFGVFFVDNMIILIVLAGLCISSFGLDEIIFKNMKANRKKMVLRRLVFFINLFKTNIMSGDNVYLALESCSKEIEGELGRQLKKTVKEFRTKGNTIALLNLAKRVEVEELDDFISIVITGLENDNDDFAKFLDENERTIQEIKESKAIERQTTKPLKAVLANGMGFMGVISVVMIAFLLNTLKYIRMM